MGVELTILGCGTSTGVPMIGCSCEVCSSSDPKNKRLRSSALINRAATKILIDTTPDFRQQALKYGITHLDAILYTHSHADHVLGIDDIRGFNFLQKKKIPVYGSELTFSELRNFLPYLFNVNPRYEGGMAPQIELKEIEYGVVIQIGDLKIIPFELLHGQISVTGYRIGDIAYATDCNEIPESSRQLLKGLKTLILDGLRFEGHKTHFTIPQAVEIAREIGAKKTYITHMSHAVEYNKTSATLPDGVFLAYDGLVVNS